MIHQKFLGDYIHMADFVKQYEEMKVLLQDMTDKLNKERTSLDKKAIMNVELQIRAIKEMIELYEDQLDL